MNLTKLIQKISELKKAECNLFLVALRFLYYYWFFGKKIIAHQKTTIKGIQNIKISKDSILFIGTTYRGFLIKQDRTLINVKGTLCINGKVRLAQGVRIDISEKGILELGDGVSINSFTTVICTDKIVIGEGTGIGWKCQFLDNDFHSIECWGKGEQSKSIILGKNIWIADYTHIYKGVEIANGCVVASDSVIKTKFLIPNSFICMKNVAIALPGQVKEWGY